MGDITGEEYNGNINILRLGQMSEIVLKKFSGNIFIIRFQLYHCGK